MNLYVPNAQLDSPFGYGDLEWLYRQQDVDGSSLVSRLAQLAPISFSNPVDGQRRRRLYALDSWETNNFVWTNDNPGQRVPEQRPVSRRPRTQASSELSASLGQSFRQRHPDHSRSPASRRHRWPTATRGSTSITRCRSPTIPTRRSARSGSATPITPSRPSSRPRRSTRRRSWRSSASS